MLITRMNSGCPMTWNEHWMWWKIDSDMAVNPKVEPIELSHRSLGWLVPPTQMALVAPTIAHSFGFSFPLALAFALTFVDVPWFVNWTKSQLLKPWRQQLTKMRQSYLIFTASINFNYQCRIFQHLDFESKAEWINRYIIAQLSQDSVAAPTNHDGPRSMNST